jgi:hypothetical protein
MPLKGIPLTVLFLCSLCFLMLNAFGHNQVARASASARAHCQFPAVGVAAGRFLAPSRCRNSQPRTAALRGKAASRRAEQMFSPFSPFPHVKCFFWGNRREQR